MPLLIHETFVNLTKGYQFGDSDWYEPFTDNIGQLFRCLQREYGKCVSRVYIDTPDGQPDAIGWVFHKTMRYEDARSKHDTYLREVWVMYKLVAGKKGSVNYE